MFTNQNGIWLACDKQPYDSYTILGRCMKLDCLSNLNPIYYISTTKVEQDDSSLSEPTIKIVFFNNKKYLPEYAP